MFDYDVGIGSGPWATSQTSLRQQRRRASVLNPNEEGVWTLRNNV
jgi:hypothetical protein